MASSGSVVQIALHLIPARPHWGILSQGFAHTYTRVHGRPNCRYHASGRCPAGCRIMTTAMVLLLLLLLLPLPPPALTACLPQPLRKRAALSDCGRKPVSCHIMDTYKEQKIFGRVFRQDCPSLLQMQLACPAIAVAPTNLLYTSTHASLAPSYLRSQLACLCLCRGQLH